MADRLFIGIPILNRADLLERCLACIDFPADILIVNNNSYDQSFKATIDNVARRFQADTRHQLRNLGVSASWNLICLWGMGLGYDRIVIGSNDTMLRGGTLEKVAQLPPAADDPVGIWHIHVWNFFAINTWVIPRVGLFDENFYPAYKEDQDYSYRCELAGVRRQDLPGADAEHLGSQTINSDRDYFQHNRNTHFHWNANHYQLKWGAEAGEEQFKTPFNKPDKDHRWWPDPRESLIARDWDNQRKSSPPSP